MAEPQYKWSHPIEWLNDHLETETHDRDDLISIARSLASALDGDQIQDLFQTEMDADGYFTPITGKRGARG